MRLTFEVAAEIGDAAGGIGGETFDELIGRDVLDEVDGEGREAARAGEPAGAALVDEIEMQPEPFALGARELGIDVGLGDLPCRSVRGETVGADESRHIGG